MKSPASLCPDLHGREGAVLQREPRQTRSQLGPQPGREQDGKEMHSPMFPPSSYSSLDWGNLGFSKSRLNQVQVMSIFVIALIVRTLRLDLITLLCHRPGD